MIITLPHEFKLRHYQEESYRASFIDQKRFTIDIWHRRAGKSKAAINFALACAMNKVGNYFHTFPELTQARRAIWNNIDSEGRRYIDHIPKELMDGNPNNSEMRIDLINGSMIQLAGADRYDALMGGNPQGIIFDEYSIQNPLAWHYLSPIITENGGWAKFIYTPRGYNHGYDLYLNNLNNENWHVKIYTIDDTKRLDGSPVVTKEQIDELIRSGIPKEIIRQEFYCDFNVALATAFYKDEIADMTKEKRITKLEPIKQLPVHTAWDIGRRDPTSIFLFQVYDGKVRLLTYYENVKKGMDFYIQWVKSYLTTNHLKQGVHFAPHDINVHEWTNGRSRIDEAARHGFFFKAVPKLSIMDGINCVRSLFPSLMMDETNCKIALNALKQYQSNDDGEPIHDWTSHCADALRTLAVGWHDSYASQSLYNPYTLKAWNP